MNRFRTSILIAFFVFGCLMPGEYGWGADCSTQLNLMGDDLRAPFATPGTLSYRFGDAREIFVPGYLLGAIASDSGEAPRAVFLDKGDRIHSLPPETEIKNDSSMDFPFDRLFPLLDPNVDGGCYARAVAYCAGHTRRLKDFREGTAPSLGSTEVQANANQIDRVLTYANREIVWSNKLGVDIISKKIAQRLGKEHDPIFLFAIQEKLRHNFLFPGLKTVHFPTRYDAALFSYFVSKSQIDEYNRKVFDHATGQISYATLRRPQIRYYVGYGQEERRAVMLARRGHRAIVMDGDAQGVNSFRLMNIVRPYLPPNPQRVILEESDFVDRSRVLSSADLHKIDTALEDFFSNHGETEEFTPTR